MFEKNKFGKFYIYFMMLFWAGYFIFFGIIFGFGFADMFPTMLGFANAPSQKIVIQLLKNNPDAPVEKIIKDALKML